MGAIDSRQLRLSRVNVSGVARDLNLAGTLGAMEYLAVEFASPVEIVQDPELSKHQFAILLLQTAADIEHALLVQYLYAAYYRGVGELLRRCILPRHGSWMDYAKSKHLPQRQRAGEFARAT